MQLFSNTFVQVDLSIYENIIKERDFANMFVKDVQPCALLLIVLVL